MVDKKPFFIRSRRVILMVTAVLVIVLVSSSIYAYYRSMPPRTGPRVSLVSPPLEFSLQLEKTTFVSGENISVSISLRNISNQTITAIWSQYSVASWTIPGQLTSSIFPDHPGRVVLDFILSDENGTSICRLFARENTATVSRILAPQEIVTQTFLWNQRVPNIWFDSPAYVFVPSGVYYIKGTTIPMSVEGWAFFEQPETSSIAIEII